VIFHSVSHWATRAMRMSRNVLSVAYVPRLTRLLAVLYPSALDFLLNISVALVAVVIYFFTRGKLYIQPFSVHTAVGVGGILLIAGWGIVLGMFTAPLSAYAKDVRYALGYVIQLWYFVTPVALPLSEYHGAIRHVVELNPLTAPLMLIQWGFLSTSFPPTVTVLSSLGLITVLAILGAWLFGRFERTDIRRL
jgi:lipopolysaccharide transport system permease protein